MKEDKRRRQKDEGSRDGKGSEMEQKGKSRIRSMSHWKRQSTSLTPQDRKSR